MTRDVQHAILLAGGALAGAVAQLLVGQRALARAVEPDEPQPDLVAVDHEVVLVAGAFAAEVGDDDRRELEALGGMDRHEPHRLDVAELDGRVGLARLGFELGRREVREAAHVAAVVALESGGEAQELVDVREPPRAAGEREHVQVVAGRVHDPTQQLVEAQPRRERALRGEALGEDEQALAIARGDAVEEAAHAPWFEKVA